MPNASQASRTRSRADAPRYDVLGLGCAAVDDLIFVESFPAADAKTRVLRRERHCGGLTTTALVAASRLGARCAYAGTLGHDELSQFVIETLKREGVGVEHVPFDAGARPLHATIVVASEGQSRNIFLQQGGATGACADAPSEEVIRSAQVLFIDQFGEGGGVRAASLAREAGIAVVADIEASSGENFDDLLRLVDHLIVSRSFACELTGATTPQDALACLHSPERAVTIVTAGGQGCWYRVQDDPEPRHFPAFAVPVVDTTGCGDAFHGAYAAALAWGSELEERIRLASAVAALKATQAGGQQGLPRRNEVERFLAQREAEVSR